MLQFLLGALRVKQENSTKGKSLMMPLPTTMVEKVIFLASASYRGDNKDNYPCFPFLSGEV